MAQSGDAPNQDIVMRILSVLCGVAMTALAVYTWIDFEVHDALDIVLPFYYILFGIVMCLTEFNPEWLLKYFHMLRTSFGKGLFYILIGCLCFNYAEVFYYIVAALVIACGIFIMFCSVVDGKPQGCDPPETENAYSDLKQDESY